MWHKALIHQLTQDILPLRRQGLDFTWKTLDELRARLARATVYECGQAADVDKALAALEDAGRPSLFDSEMRIRDLPQAFMLLEFTDSEGTDRAALLSDRMDSVEIYVFRHDRERNRWRWPLLGMSYGPTFEENRRVAVYEPSALAGMSAQAQKAMVREHVLGAGRAVSCLELVRRGLVAPLDAAGPSAEHIMDKRVPRPELPRPSSFARAARSRHETGRVGKGTHRM